MTAGIAVGSVSSQAVVMVDDELFAFSNTRAGSDSPDSARRVLSKITGALVAAVFVHAFLEEGKVSSAKKI